MADEAEQPGRFRELLPGNDRDMKDEKLNDVVRFGCFCEREREKEKCSEKRLISQDMCVLI